MKKLHKKSYINMYEMDGICGFPGNTKQVYSYRKEWRNRDRGIIVLTHTDKVSEKMSKRDWNLETNVNKENVYVSRGCLVLFKCYLIYRTETWCCLFLFTFCHSQQYRNSYKCFFMAMYLKRQNNCFQFVFVLSFFSSSLSLTFSFNIFFFA